MAKESKNTLQGIQAFAPVAETGKCASMNPVLINGYSSDTARCSNLATQSLLVTQSLHGLRNKSSHTKDYAKEIKTTNEMAKEASTILGPNMLGALRAGPKESEKKTASQVQDKDDEDSSGKDGEDDPRQSRRLQKRRGEPGIREGSGGKGRHHSHSPNRRHSQSPNRKTSCRPRKSKPTKSRKNKSAKPVTNPADNVGIDLEDGLDDYELGPAESENQHNKPKGRVRKTRQSDAKRCGRRGRNGARCAAGSRTRGNIHQEQLTQMTNVDQTKVFREEDLVYCESESEFDGQEEEEIATTSTRQAGYYVTSALSGAAVASERAAVLAAASAERAATLAAGGAAAATGTVYHAASAAGGTMLNYGGAVFNVLNTAASTAVTVTIRGNGAHERFDEFESEDFDSSEDEDEPVEKPVTSLAYLIS